MEAVDKFSWPPEYLEMKKMEQLLRCGICYDFIDTSVMTPCSHNYCSYCIRKYLHYKTQCPACFQMTFEKDLHTNRVLDELIIQFMKIRVKLINCLSEVKASSTKNNSTNETCELLMKSQPTRPPRSNYSKSPGKLNELSEVEKSFVDGNHSVNESIKKFLSSPSKIKVDLNNSIKDELHEDGLNMKNSSCPVCHVRISQVYMSRHVDECMKRKSIEATSTSKSNNERKLMPKLVFNLMKDSELKKKMKLLNLPTQGDRKTLEKRFQRYCTLYNAECDKKKPRSINELLEQCKNEEMIEKKLEKSLKTNKITVSRNAAQTVIDQANREYLQMNARSYQDLISSIKSRIENKKLIGDVHKNAECAASSSKSASSPVKHKPAIPADDLTSSDNNEDSSEASNDTSTATEIPEATQDKCNDSEDSKRCQFIWSQNSNHEKKSKVLSEETTSHSINDSGVVEGAAETNSTENQIEIEDNDGELIPGSEESNSSVDCQSSPSYLIRKRNHHSSEPDVGENLESNESSKTESETPTSAEIFQLNKIDTDDIDPLEKYEQPKLTDSTMKRRRRQNRIVSSDNNEINPPSRPVRKRTVISSNLEKPNNE